MISPEARRAIARIRAESVGQDEVPLVESRRNWEAAARQHKLPRGARFAAATAGGIAGEWMEMPGVPQDRVMLLLHGGGYVSGSPRTHRKLAAYLSSVCRMRVLMPDYRLAPEHPFPAGVQDALKSYGWLIGDGGIRAEDVIVAGDSAGGGLALSMMLALREAKAPLPGAAILLSPWTDLTASSPSYRKLRDRDPSITQEGLRSSGLMYAGKRDPADPMASPLFAELSGLPPLLIHVGGDEVMLDDSRLLADRARAAGVEVNYKLWPGLWHVFHGEAPEVPEANEALKEIAAFCQARVGREAA